MGISRGRGGIAASRARAFERPADISNFINSEAGYDEVITGLAQYFVKVQRYFSDFGKITLDADEVTFRQSYDRCVNIYNKIQPLFEQNSAVIDSVDRKARRQITFNLISALKACKQAYLIAQTKQTELENAQNKEYPASSTLLKDAEQSYAAAVNAWQVAMSAFATAFKHAQTHFQASELDSIPSEVINNQIKLDMLLQARDEGAVFSAETTRVAKQYFKFLEIKPSLDLLATVNNANSTESIGFPALSNNYDLLNASINMILPSAGVSDGLLKARQKAIATLKLAIEQKLTSLTWDESDLIKLTSSQLNNILTITDHLINPDSHIAVVSQSEQLNVAAFQVYAIESQIIAKIAENPELSKVSLRTAAERGSIIAIMATAKMRAGRTAALAGAGVKADPFTGAAKNHLVERLNPLPQVAQMIILPGASPELSTEEDAKRADRFTRKDSAVSVGSKGSRRKTFVSNQQQQDDALFKLNLLRQKTTGAAKPQVTKQIGKPTPLVIQPAPDTAITINPLRAPANLSPNALSNGILHRNPMLQKGLAGSQISEKARVYQSFEKRKKTIANAQRTQAIAYSVCCLIAVGLVVAVGVGLAFLNGEFKESSDSHQFIVPNATASANATALATVTATALATITSSILPSLYVSMSATSIPSLSLSSSLTSSASVSPSIYPTISQSLAISPSVTMSTSGSGSITATLSTSASASFSSSPSLTPSISASVSLSTSHTPSATDTATASKSTGASSSNTATVSVSASNSGSLSATETATASRSVTASVSPSSSATPSPTNTQSMSDSTSRSTTPTPSISASNSVTLSASTTASVSNTNTVSVTPSSSVSMSDTGSATASSSYTSSSTESLTPSHSPTPTNTVTQSNSVSPSNSMTSSASVSATPSVSNTNTVSVTPSSSVSMSGTGSSTVSNSYTASTTPSVSTSASATGGANTCVSEFTFQGDIGDTFSLKRSNFTSDLSVTRVVLSLTNAILPVDVYWGGRKRTGDTSVTSDPITMVINSIGEGSLPFTCYNAAGNAICANTLDIVTAPNARLLKQQTYYTQASSSRYLKNYKNHKIAGISLRDEGILRGENRDSFPLMQARIHFVRRIKSREGGLADFSGSSCTQAKNYALSFFGSTEPVKAIDPTQEQANLNSEIKQLSLQIALLEKEAEHANKHLRGNLQEQMTSLQENIAARQTRLQALLYPDSEHAISAGF